MTASTTCPFCNTRHAAAPGGQAACPSCGRGPASAAPALPVTPAMQGPAMSGSGRTIDADWDGPELGGSLELARGGSIAGGASAPSAYAASPASFGDDDPFADDVSDAASLELDVPAGHAANAPRGAPEASRSPATSPAAVASGAPAVPDLVLPASPQSASALPASPQSASALPASPQSAPALPAAPQSASALAVAPPPPSSDPSVARPAAPPIAPADPAALIARYPAPPAQVWGAPAYAMNVLWRQFELRQDLASLRKRRSPDVPLFERALHTHDRRMFTLGLAISCAALALAVFVFFLPVIARFARAP